MPQTILFVTQAVSSYIAKSAIARAIFTISLNLAINYVTGSLQNRQSPRPEDVQQTVKGAVQSRYRHYGRVKASGQISFLESKNGALYKVAYLGEGEFDAIESLWIDDKEVEVNGSDIVTTAPFTDKCKIQYKLGTASQTAYSDLTSTFTEYTTDHKGNGCAHLYARQYPVGSDQFLKTFPNGINTTYSVVARCAKVYNPVTEVTEWDDNAAAVILDYMKHADGFNIPAAAFETPQAVAGWIAAYNKCDEDVDLNAGGTEKRYRIWGSYSLNDERRADVLNRMLACCDGKLILTPDGGVTIEIGEWAEPTVTIDSSIITGWTDFSNGLEDGLVANTIKSKYLEPDHGYVTAEADSWVNADDVTARGERATPVDFLMSTSHTQTRRLMKLAYYRTNPQWIGRFSLNVRGLKVLGKRFARITYPGFNLDEVFEIRSAGIQMGEGNLLLGVLIDVFSMPQAAYDWDETTEEGTPPAAENSTTTSTIPDPTGVDVTIDRITVNGLPVPVADVDWDAPSDTALTTEVRFKLTSGADWQSIPVLRDTTVARSGVLSDGEEYEFQVRHVSVVGRAGDWSASVEITPTADETPPSPPTAVSGTGGVGQATINWTTPNSANFNRSKVYRNTVNTFGSSTLIQTIYGTKNAAMSYTNTGLSAGTYYYWVTAENASGVASSAVATGAVVVV